jgi:anti-anti-sigma regulatory factor
MAEVAQGWQLRSDVVDDWLIVGVARDGHEPAYEPAWAESIWAVAVRHGKTRLAIELDDGLLLNSLLVGQLVRLHKRAHLGGGTVRVCGLSLENERILRMMGLADRFPNYPSREAAVALPNKPR